MAGTPPSSIPLLNGLPYGSNGSLVSGSIPPAYDGVSILGGTALRNRIVNGDMRIDQANAGASVVVNAAGPVFSVDKWKAAGTGAAGVFTLQRSTATAPSGFTNYLRATVTTADAAPAAGSIYQLTQAVEGLYCQDLQFGLATGQSVAVGFLVRSSLTGAFSASLRNNALNRSYPFSFTISAANTWQFISIPIVVDQTGTWLTDTNAGFILTFDLGGGTTFKSTANTWQAGNFVGITGAASLLATNGATFDLTSVTVEPGRTSTSFEQRPFGDMLRLCQREFFKTFSQATAPVQNAGVNTGEITFPATRAAALLDFTHYAWPVVMRATPALVLFNTSVANAQVRDNGGGVDCSASAGSGTTERSTQIICTGNAATTIGNDLKVHLTADARL